MGQYFVSSSGSRDATSLGKIFNLKLNPFVFSHYPIICSIYYSFLSFHLRAKDN